MRILTNQQMRMADEYTINVLGVPSLELMERAGRALAKEAEALAPNGRVLCVCGGGNNGGDGFVCARILKTDGWEVDVVFFAERISKDCLVNKEKWTEIGGAILSETPKKGYALVVDCLVGTGLKGALIGKNAEAVEGMNALKKQGAKVLSADIPSGLCGDNGLAYGTCVCADVTLCIGEIKAGTALADGLDCAGEVKCVDIGICLTEESYAERLTKEKAALLLPTRKRNSHKGTYGKAAIVAGSVEYTGAAYLSAAACLRSGAGYTTLFVPSGILPCYLLKAPEILLKSTNEGGRYEFNEGNMRSLLGYNAVAYGMGMGISEEVAKGAEFLLRHYEGKLILDADGLNSLAAFRAAELADLFENKKCDVICTPHGKEFSRLSGMDMQEIVENGLYAATGFAKTHSVNLLLKNAATIITDGERICVNTAGSSGQAKGGSGDVLAGVLAGLCAMGMTAFDGGCLAAYLCGKSAEIAVARIGEYSLTATDIIGCLGEAFLSLKA